MWFKEYTMNVILQPVHLLLYMSLISSASDLVVRNPIYALVAIGFLIPAEKFIKRMFGLDKASSTSDFGTFAKNALALQGLKQLSSAVSGKDSKANNAKTSDSQDKEEAKFNKIRRAELGSFQGNTDESESYDNDEESEPIRTNESMQNQNEQGTFEGTENNGYTGAIPRTDSTEQEETGQEQERLDRERMQRQGQRPRQPINANSVTPRTKIKGYKRRLAGRAGKVVLKGGYKGLKMLGRTAGTVLGTGIGATIGLASAIATGDPSNVAQYMISGAGAGKAVGKAMGKGITELPENLIEKAKDAYHGIEDAYGTARNAVNEEKYGYSEAKNIKNEKENAKARKEFLKDKEQQKKYAEMAGKVGYKDANLKKFMNAVADYKEAGLDDEMIQNALKAEVKRDKTVGGINHEKMIDVAKFAADNGYSKSDILNKESRSNMEDVVQATVAEKDRFEVMKSIADLYGAGDFYSRKSRFKQNNRPPVSNPSSSTNSGNSSNNG